MVKAGRKSGTPTSSRALKLKGPAISTCAATPTERASHSDRPDPAFGTLIPVPSMSPTSMSEQASKRLRWESGTQTEGRAERRITRTLPSPNEVEKLV